MPKCPNCNIEVNAGQKFCFECGTKIPQEKTCPQCGNVLPMTMKFCSECGYNFNAAAAPTAGLAMGDENVIAGDVVGQKVAGDNVANKVMGNIIHNTIKDDTKSVNHCCVCGIHMTNDTGHTCPKCGECVCSKHFNSEFCCCEKCVEVAKAEEAEKVFEDSRDGNEYKLVRIGRKIWFAENFRYAVDGAYSHDDDEAPEKTKKYGYLYTWQAAVDACPEGFHLPTIEEWKELINTVASSEDSSEDISCKLKTCNGWNGSNKFGFDATPAGYMQEDDESEELECVSFGEETDFWSCSKKEDDCFGYVELGEKSIKTGNIKGSWLFSVRYVKDEFLFSGDEPVACVHACENCGAIMGTEKGEACIQCGNIVCEECFDEEEKLCSSCIEQREEEEEAERVRMEEIAKAEQVKRENEIRAQKKLEAAAKKQAEEAKRIEELKNSDRPYASVILKSVDFNEYKVRDVLADFLECSSYDDCIDDIVENKNSLIKAFVEQEDALNLRKKLEYWGCGVEFEWNYTGVDEIIEAELSEEAKRIEELKNSGRPYASVILTSCGILNGNVQKVLAEFLGYDEDDERLRVITKNKNSLIKDFVEKDAALQLKKDLEELECEVKLEWNSADAEKKITDELLAKKYADEDIADVILVDAGDDTERVKYRVETFTHNYGWFDGEKFSCSKFDNHTQKPYVFLSEMNFEIAYRMKKELEDLGASVILDRHDGTDIDYQIKQIREAKLIAAQKAEEERLAKEAEEKRKEEERIAAEQERIAAEKAAIDACRGFYVDPKDDQVYKTIKIGDQVWFAENYRYDYDGSVAFDAQKYGRLYSRLMAKRMTPSGWHLPTEQEFEILKAYCKTKNEKMSWKALTAKSEWKYFEGIDSFGYAALPAGFYDGSYKDVGTATYFWCYSKGTVYDYHARSWKIEIKDSFVFSHSHEFTRDAKHFNCGLSVRYVKNDCNFFKTLEEAKQHAEEEKAIEVARHGTVVDPRDGHVYKTIRIGDQTWMAENLDYFKKGLLSSFGKRNGKHPEYGCYYSGKELAKVSFDGWHVPSMEEFKSLANYIEEHYETYHAAVVLKSSTDDWNKHHIASLGRNVSEFCALPAGTYNDEGFGGYGERCVFRSAEEDKGYRLKYDSNDFEAANISKNYLFSVRLVKD